MASSSSSSTTPASSNIGILETVEDIQIRREQVLDRYDHFKQAANIRRDKLLQAKSYAYFKFDADELESWIYEKLRIANEDLDKDITNVQNKLSRHEAFEAECTAHHSALDILDQFGQKLIQNEHYASAKIAETLNHLHRLWDELCDALRSKHFKLKQLVRYVAWIQDVQEMLYWIADKEAEIIKPSPENVARRENMSELEWIESERKRYDEVQKDLRVQEPKVLVLGARAEELIETSEGTLNNGEIRDKQRELNEAWNKLKNLAITKQESLYGAHEMQRFLRDIEETISWMDEKSASLVQDPTASSSSSANTSQQDLNHIASLQRKHEAFERSLSTLGEKVEALEREGDRLAKIPANERSVPVMTAKLNELRSKWSELLNNVDARKIRLETLRKLYQFLSDSMDLLAWYDDIAAVLSQDDSHVRDIESVELLIERNIEYKKDVESRDENLSKAISQGEELVDLVDDKELVKDRLLKLKANRAKLATLWIQKNRLLTERLKYLLFMRDADQLENWIRKQENFLNSANNGESLDDVELLTKKHMDFEKSLTAHEEKVKHLNDYADELIVEENHMKNEIRHKRNEVQDRFERLKQAAQLRSLNLAELYKYFMFERNCEEMLSWIAEKIKLAQTNEYLDPANLQAKQQKHTSFESEIALQEPKVENLCANGEELAKELPQQSVRIEDIVRNLKLQWNELLAATQLKGLRLKQAIEAQLFYRSLADLDLWLNESEHAVYSKDYGRDLASTLTLKRRLADLEDEWSTKLVRVRELDQDLNRMLSEGHFDSDHLRENGEVIKNRFFGLEQPINDRKKKLDEALRAHEMRRDLGDEEQWIREKELTLSASRKQNSTDYTEVKKLVQKHQTFMSELTGHEARVSETIKRCEQLLEQLEAHNDLVRPLERLKSNWAALKENSEQRRIELEDALNLANYMAEATEAEGWIREKEQLIGNETGSIGKDEEATEAMLKRHSAVMVDIEAFGQNTVYGDLRNLASKCKDTEPKKRDSGLLSADKKEFIVVLYDYSAHGVSVRKGDVLPLLSTSNNEWWKVELENGKRDYVPANYVKKVEQQQQPQVKPSGVALKQQQIEREYEHLLGLAQRRKAKLQDACDMHRLSRETADIAQWLNIKQDITDDVLKAYEEDPNLSRDTLETKLDSLKQEIRAKENKIDELIKLAEKLKQNNQNEEAMKVYEEIERQKKALEKFKRYVESLEVKLVKANELKKFKMDSEDTLEWINEKKLYLEDQNKIDLDNADLTSVKRMLRKHEAFELDLDALGARIKELDERCEHLIQEHPEHAGELYDSQVNLQNAWNELVLLSTKRKAQLNDAYDYQNFLASYRDLKLWLETKIKQVAIDELAHDEASIDALIERNQDHKNEIDARNGTFDDFNRYGSDLINASHPQSPAIATSLTELNDKRQELNQKWQAREKQLNECLALIFFERDCEAAEKWMTVRENALSTPTRDDEAAIEDAFRKYEDLDRAISVQEAKIMRLTYTADELVAYEHYASEEIKRRRDQVLARWERLKQALIESRADLDESLTVERFLHDAKEMIEWLDEKLDAVDELSNADLINTSDILRKQQKQELIDSEVASNAERAKYLINSGNKIIENKKCPGQEAEVRDQVNKIESKWNELTDKSAQNLLKIKDGLRKRKFVASVQDMEFWLNQVESQLQSSDLGRDLTSVQSLLKKNQAIEADIAGHEEPLNELNNADKSGKNDELLRPINKRYNAVKKACADRKEQLTDANSLFQVAHELDDEEAWLREKLLSASSTDYGRDLPSTQNLRKRHKRLEAELAAHEPVIESLNESVSRLPLNDDDEALARLRLRCQELVKGRRELASLVDSRGQRLEENLAYYKWLALIGEELAWLDDGAKLVVEPTPDGRERECGETLPQAQGYMKKHDAFETDLGVHKERVDSLVKKGEELIQSGNFQKPKIEETNENAVKLVEKITYFSALRKQRLHENWSRLQFYSRCEFIELWIIEKEEILRSSPSISSVHTLVGIKQLISKHETFSNSLEVFENEGIRPIIKLRDELLEAQSLEQEKPKINERFQIVYARWRQLVGASEKRWRELREAENNVKSIDDLLLEFAKRAYELNSWFENAEEDLSDPVRCFSIEQVKDMFKSHDVFLASLGQVVQDLNAIKELDIRIKQVYKHPNPYTWHTVESLMDSWSVIQRANADREVDLEKERERQTENDRLRKQYAEAAKQFYKWVTETRVEMLDMGSSGTMSLEEQLNATRYKLDEIRDAQQRFQPVEELSATLEERLVFDNKYTEHTTLGLAQAWDQLDQLGLRMINNLQQQIQALSQTGVTEDSLREFSHIFRHFDTNKSGRLSHAEFKMCLRALGYDLAPDEQRAIDLEFERILDIVDPQRLGYVGLQDYMSFLIRKETENISSMDDVIDAFKALTENGDKPYITRKELVSNLSPDQAEYCLRKMAPYRDHTGREIPDTYDYQNFTRTLFKG